jgi:NitT/TauT family transport system ATP-binding protein
VNPGEFVCLIGPSGCGKTTLLNLLAGFITPTEGRILLKEQLIEKPGPDRGVVFQEYALFPWLNVCENVAFGLKNTGYSTKEAVRKALETLELVGLSDFQKARPHQLSGGMKQRVAIARVWALDPVILLMDEPFGALDAQIRTFMQQSLLEIWSGSNKTIVFITHSVKEAVFLADRVIVFSPRPGRVIKEVQLDLPRPRSQYDPQVQAYEEEILLTMDGNTRSAGDLTGEERYRLSLRYGT